MSTELDLCSIVHITHTKIYAKSLKFYNHHVEENCIQYIRFCNLVCYDLFLYEIY